jgi:PAS domain S-box-containing protein
MAHATTSEKVKHLRARERSSRVPPNLTIVPNAFLPTAARSDFHVFDDLLNSIVELTASNVAVVDESGSVLYASRTWKAFEAGDTGEAVRANAVKDNFVRYVRNPALFGEVRPYTLKDDLECVLLGVELEFRRRYRYHGSTDSRECTIHAVRVDQGQTFRIILTHEEVASQIEALRRSEARLSHLLQSTKTFVWEADTENWQFSYVSPEAVNVLGYPLGDWYHPDFLSSHLHPMDRDELICGGLKQCQIAGKFELLFRMRHKNGEYVWLQMLVSLRSEKVQPAVMHGFMIDVSERQHTEEELRDLGGRLIAAQEEERRRVARELHDGLNQRMAVLSIELEQIGHRIRKSIAGERQFHTLQSLAREISGDIHRLSYRLHPSKLEHLGLSTALKSLCEEMSARGTLKVQCRQKAIPTKLPMEQTLCVFRIAQEALRNAVKYSGAETVRVELEKKGAVLQLSVADDGCGFDMKSNVMEKGLGFISMRERLHLVAGEFHVYSAPNKGTRIEVRVPLKPARRSKGNHSQEHQWSQEEV